uniref:hypothetical protein n=1 Tax=Kineosporia sp. A_224 TaxID=1962180 RepID=UPI0013044436
SRTGTPRGTFDAFSHLGDAPAQPAPVLVTAGAGGPPGTLTEVHERLRAGAFAGNEWALDGVLTRVALRTGADVRAPRPDQVADPAVVREVVTVLERMGYGELSGADAERPRWWSRGRRRAGPNTLTSTPDR